MSSISERKLYNPATTTCCVCLSSIVFFMEAFGHEVTAFYILQMLHVRVNKESNLSFIIYLLISECDT